MKKLIILLMLAIFCLSLAPVFAMDYNPYDNDNISDKPATREHPWDPYKYDKDSTDYKSDGPQNDCINAKQGIFEKILDLFFKPFKTSKKKSNCHGKESYNK